MEEKIVVVINEMAEYLSISQMKKLQEVMLRAFAEKEQDKSKVVAEKNWNIHNICLVA